MVGLAARRGGKDRERTDTIDYASAPRTASLRQRLQPFPERALLILRGRGASVTRLHGPQQ